MSSRGEKEILGLRSRKNAVADTEAAVTVTGTLFWSMTWAMAWKAIPISTIVIA